MGTCTSPEDERTDAYSRITAQVAGDQLVGVMGLVCADHECPMVAARIGVFRDTGHVSRTWSLHVADSLGARLRLDL